MNFNWLLTIRNISRRAKSTNILINIDPMFLSNFSNKERRCLPARNQS